MTKPDLRSDAGFTLVEVLVVLVIGSFVLGAVYEIMISQSQAFGRQGEIVDVQNSLRSTAVLLTTELRAVDAQDLYSMDASSLHLRSYTGSGIICGKDAASRRFALIDTSGGFTSTPGDSVLVLSVGGAGSADDEWKVFPATEVGTGPDLGVSTCSWGETPDVAIRISPASPSDTDGIAVGGSVLAFQPVEYGLYQDAGRWWFARRVGLATSWEILTGPLLSPAEGGLEFAYVDGAGDPAASLQDIAAVRIVVRAESFGQTRSKRGLQHVRDTLAMRIVMRNGS